MHELSIAEGIARQTEAHLRSVGVPAEDVRLIRVRVGDLSGADPHALAECLRALLPGTRLGAAAVEVEREPARIVCPRCGETPARSPLRLACPSCGGVPERVDGGQDIVVESVEVEGNGRP